MWLCRNLEPPESRGASSFSTMKSNCNLGMQLFSDKHMLAFEWENMGKMIIFKTRQTRFTSFYIHFTIHSFQISRKQEQS